MRRSARIVVPGVAHHVTQRGNRRQQVFFSAKDCLVYLDLMRLYLDPKELRLHAYCLMPNHVHLIVTPVQEESLSITLGPVHQSYAQHINRSYCFEGRLWQGRFFSCPLEEPHLWAAMRYVERNPVRAGLATIVQQYRWSSAVSHCLTQNDPLLRPLEQIELKPAEWADWVSADDDERMLKRIRISTMTGQPLGSPDFIKRCQKTSQG